MQKAKPNPLIYTLIIVGLLIVAGIAVVLAANSRSDAAAGFEIVRLEPTTTLHWNAYSVRKPAGLDAERWKYVIRDDGACDSSVFTDGGRGAGNYTAVVYKRWLADDGIVYDPADAAEAAEHDGKYVCFQIKELNGGWVSIGTRLDLGINQESTGPPEGSDAAEVADLDCPSHQTEKNGQCTNPCDDTAYSDDFEWDSFDDGNQNYVLVNDRCVSVQEVSEILRSFYSCVQMRTNAGAEAEAAKLVLTPFGASCIDRPAGIDPTAD